MKCTRACNQVGELVPSDQATRPYRPHCTSPLIHIRVLKVQVSYAYCAVGALVLLQPGTAVLASHIQVPHSDSGDWLSAKGPCLACRYVAVHDVALSLLEASEHHLK